MKRKRRNEKIITKNRGQKRKKSEKYSKKSQRKKTEKQKLKKNIAGKNCQLRMLLLKDLGDKVA